jgi:hypothetical protein
VKIDPEDLVHQYARMSEVELLEFARTYDSLTAPAQTALRAEFSRRNLDPPEVEENLPATSRSLVTVRRYRDLSEAIVARSLLESAGIAAYLRDENLVRLDWQISNFIGGLRLQVEATDEAAAVELLAQEIPASIPFDHQAEFAQPHCLQCGSINITFEGSSRGAALASLYLLSLPFPQRPKTWICNSCGARWEETEGDTSDTGASTTS